MRCVRVCVVAAAAAMHGTGVAVQATKPVAQGPLQKIPKHSKSASPLLLFAVRAILTRAAQDGDRDLMSADKYLFLMQGSILNSY